MFDLNDEFDSLDYCRWTKGPQQSRSKKSLAIILDAALQLLKEEGVENLSIVNIASRAGYSSGVLYSRFVDKDSLLQAVHERLAEEMLEALKTIERKVELNTVNLGEFLDLMFDMASVYSSKQYLFTQLAGAFLAGDENVIKRKMILQRAVLNIINPTFLKFDDEEIYESLASALIFSFEQIIAHYIYQIDRGLSQFEYRACTLELKHCLHLYLSLRQEPELSRDIEDEKYSYDII